METYKLYENKLELKYFDDKHVYMVEEGIVESVSGVTKIVAKPALVPWAVKLTGQYITEHLKPGQGLDEKQILDLVKIAKMQHRQKSGDAADLGTMAHEWFSKYLKGENPAMPINPILKQAAEGLLAFLKRHEVKVIDSERKLYSIEHRFAGTLDLTCYVDGVKSILDFKTSSGVYAEYFLQCGGYDLAATEEDSFVALGKGEQYEPFKQHIIVNIRKPNPEKTKAETDFNPDRDILFSRNVENNKMGFLGALTLHRSIGAIKAEMGIR